MKIKLIVTSTVLLAMAFLFNACQKKPVVKNLVPQLPATPYSYTLTGVIDNSPANNAITNNGATLGRVLFYDPRLSLNNSVSCATCHKQEFAFSDNTAKSVGYEGQLTARNTPAIINAGQKATYFWDGRESLLENMVLMPVKHRVEMGLEETSVLEQKIASIDYYPELFRKAFGTTEVTSARISRALAQFVRSMVSNGSDLDLGMLTPEESAGRTVFISKQCNTCHRSSNLGGDNISSNPYSGNSSVSNAANIGLDVVYADKGIMALNSDATSDGAFKIPSLRNIAYTAPYMHDGRFKTIEEVIEHYNSGIAASERLDVVLRDSLNQPMRMNMTNADKQALAAFLRALSDDRIVTDIRFSNPF